MHICFVIADKSSTLDVFKIYKNKVENQLEKKTKVASIIGDMMKVLNSLNLLQVVEL